VLDNCEHLIDGAAAFAEEAARRCPKVRLLATSREALALAGERLWPVRPLRVPRGTRDVDEALASAPVRLFVDRVQMVRPDFGLDSENLDSVLDICRHLDGIPLAIELAAARTKSLAPGEIAERLDRRFALLSGSRRRGVSRHETLRAAVDWSYDLLEEPERELLARVAVFSGGFTLQAAERVAAGPGENETLDLLGRLVDKSLLTVEETHGSTRYRLLETIRQYALERLDAADETASARDRHLAYFVEFAEAAGRGLRTADEGLWDRRATLEAENLRSAVGWAIETQAVSNALRLVSAFSRQILWAVQTRFLAGMITEPVLELPEASEHPLYPSALAVVSELARTNGDYDRAVAQAEEALHRATATDPGRWVAEIALGHVALWTARDDPTEHFAHAVEVGRANSNDGDVAQAQGLVATGLSFHGPEHLAEACAQAEEAIKLAEKTKCPSLISSTCFTLGYILVLMGDPNARPWLERSLEGSRNVFSASGALSMLALHHLRYSTPAEALDAVEAAVRYGEYRADRSGTSTILDLAIPVFVRYDDPVTAAELRAAIERGVLPRLRRAGVAEQRRDASFAALDKRLSRDELEAAEARGVAMSYDQVVAHTLDRIQSLRTRLETPVDGLTTE